MSAVETYSKKQVQKAGRLLRDFTAGDGVKPDDRDLMDAVYAVDWWRARHAGPLRRVNAGLRYYVRKVSREGEETSVTQRLKRFSTKSVEQDTRRLGAGLKFGVGPADLRDYFRLIAEYLEARERNQDPPEELMGELSKLFAATRRHYPENEDS